MTEQNASSKLLIETVDRITIILLNRPERKNAVDGETAHLLFDAFRDFDRNDATDVAILAGAEGSFCAGADLKAFAEGGDINPVMEGGINSLAPMGPTRMQLSKPVIASIEGYAVAGGMELALWCDMRVMAENAKFGIFCRRFGVPLIDLGTLRLPRLIGQSRAMDLILTGREVDAQEAHHIGLANRITKPGQALEDALKLARQISQHPQICMRNDRRSMLEHYSLDEDAAIRHENKLGLLSMHSGETIRGARRFSAGEGRHGHFDQGDNNG
ncbi:MAG: crotonase/enoyl-CoA hydratase family protein [Hyphomicrobiales bacterium]|nr:crotonase/enoyl-CoA hydratase family protein [Hyphomicrobiales bacterium]